MAAPADVPATRTDLGHGKLLLLLLRDAPSDEARIELLARALAAARRGFADAVAATADEYGEDEAGSLVRLCELLEHEFRGGDPSERAQFAAPPEPPGAPR